jgi:hypothetical protein
MGLQLHRAEWVHSALQQLLQASATFGESAAVETGPHMQIAPWRSIDLISSAA